MVIAEAQFPQLTPDEYLTWEEEQTEKYEYIEGQIYAMGGGNKHHSLIAVRLSSLFFHHLDGSSCETGNSDLKIKIPNSDNYTYTDISVTCDEREQANTQFITYPCLIVEVLSKSTEAYDRDGKFGLYRQNPVLKDYLLVSSTAIEMDLYHKNESGEWLITNYQAGDMITLESVGLTFPIEQAYQGLRFL